jgi:DNA-binding response OmpR family regulator
MTRPYRLLVADDEPDILELVALNFAVDGFEVLTATDGIEAEDLARLEHPDVIILDIMMPGRDGLEVLASLKSDPGIRETPVVMLTAKSSDDDIWTGWRSGTDYYVTKPFDPDELVRYVSFLVSAEYQELGI